MIIVYSIILLYLYCTYNNNKQYFTLLKIIDALLAAIPYWYYYPATDGQLILYAYWYTLPHAIAFTLHIYYNFSNTPIQIKKNCWNWLVLFIPIECILKGSYHLYPFIQSELLMILAYTYSSVHLIPIILYAWLLLVGKSNIIIQMLSNILPILYWNRTG